MCVEREQPTVLDVTTESRTTLFGCLSTQPLKFLPAQVQSSRRAIGSEPLLFHLRRRAT